MSDTGRTVSVMSGPPCRYDINITVDQAGSHFSPAVLVLDASVSRQLGSTGMWPGRSSFLRSPSKHLTGPQLWPLPQSSAV
jgi:hypothetical protein